MLKSKIKLIIAKCMVIYKHIRNLNKRVSNEIKHILSIKMLTEK